MAANTGKKPSYKWTTEATRALIHFRATNEDSFRRSKQAPKKLWEQFIKEAGLLGKVEPQQAAKKWENLKTRYKELKNPKTGSGTDGGEETAATWQYYQDMHEVLGGRPSIDPPLLVASFTPDDPTTILLEIVDGPSNSTTTSAMVDGFSSSPTASTSASLMGLSSSMSPSSPPTSSPPKKKEKLNPIVEFLKAESEREQRRHEESEAKTEHFLRLFEQMVEKI
ncbi:hypothetical protein SKAU_G00093070 [Synaphobranchus kaupii]|uniref:Myb/SANT-like DNA-binding domain-containing protein n=1 Tax=Synaphobranchus kaupii TaxID=118154 RepID=A0A9Q1FWS8_SYNKA|nr:hypothetical protein SKAU_G00093070 [Synaphobranchus kaupii]